MIVIGLTGSVGMGKTTTAAMLQRLGVPVFDSDAEVHKMTSTGGRAAAALAKAFPPYQYPSLYGRMTKQGRSIKRAELVKIVLADAQKLQRVESITHPLVREAQNDFIRKHRTLGVEIIALDVPLLFETGADLLCDVTMVASAPYAVQQARVLARPRMDEKKFQTILQRQMPDGEKRARADYVIQTGLGRAQAMKDVKAALASIRKKAGKPPKTTKEQPRGKKSKKRAYIRT